MRFRNEFTVPYDRATVLAWYYHTGAFARLAPSFNHVTADDLARPVSDGMVNSFRFRAGPFRLKWKALHHVDAERNFTDEMLAGPFGAWKHFHQFVAADQFT